MIKRNRGGEQTPAQYVIDQKIINVIFELDLSQNDKKEIKLRERQRERGKQTPAKVK